MQYSSAFLEVHNKLFGLGDIHDEGVVYYVFSALYYMSNHHGIVCEFYASFAAAFSHRVLCKQGVKQMAKMAPPWISHA